MQTFANRASLERSHSGVTENLNQNGEERAGGPNFTKRLARRGWKQNWGSGKLTDAKCPIGRQRSAEIPEKSTKK